MRQGDSCGEKTYRLSVLNADVVVRRARCFSSSRWGGGKGKFVVGPLSVSDPERIEQSLEKAVSVLSQCLLQFSNAIPNNWKLGDAPGGYLCTNIAIRAIFILIKDICDHVAKDTGSNLSQFTADELVKDIVPFLNPVVEYFKNANPPQIASFRKFGSSLGAVKQQSQGMGVFVRKEFPEFNPRGLQEYIDSRDEAGTADAAVLINQIGKIIFDYVIATLKREYGDVKDVWWTKGIPFEVRKKSGNLWEENNREMPEESYLYLVDYINIAHFNWDLMKDAFALGAKNEQNWKECLKWVKKLADIRTITHHPEKGVLTVDQVAYVREIADKVERHFVG